MKTKIIPIVIVAIGLATAACGSSATTDNNEKQSDTTVAKKETIEIQEFTRSAKSSPADKLRFSRAELTVLGIRIPAGMIPEKHAPTKVYRFVGSYTRSYPVAQAISMIESQIHTTSKDMEGKGCIFRDARVKSSNAKSKKLAIRIFDSNKRGATIDIWLETQFGKRIERNSAQGNHSGGRRTVTSAKGTNNISVKANQAIEKRTAATFRALEKVRRKEPLTQEELSSGAFD
jgi:hypothetical protein